MKLHPLFVGENAPPIRSKILRIDAPLSFWGGVNPHTGRLVEPPSGEPTEVSGRIVCLRRPRGSSSSSAVLLELIYRRLAPAALILGEPDAILGLGAIVGMEMGWQAPPIYALSAEAIAGLGQNVVASILGHELKVGDENTPSGAEALTWPT